MPLRIVQTATAPTPVPRTARQLCNAASHWHQHGFGRLNVRVRCLCKITSTLRVSGQEIESP